MPDLVLKYSKRVENLIEKISVIHMDQNMNNRYFLSVHVVNEIEPSFVNLQKEGIPKTCLRKTMYRQVEVADYEVNMLMDVIAVLFDAIVLSYYVFKTDNELRLFKLKHPEISKYLVWCDHDDYDYLGVEY